MNMFKNFKKKIQYKMMNNEQKISNILHKSLKNNDINISKIITNLVTCKICNKINCNKIDSYDTLDNGGIPFTVKLNHFSYNIDIYINQCINDDECVRVFFKSFDIIEHFIDDGYALLFRIKSDIKNKFKYIYIGDEIMTFNTDIKINFFKSVVGNSAVSYAHASNDKYYFFFSTGNKIPKRIEKKYIDNIINERDCYIDIYGKFFSLEEYEENNIKNINDYKLLVIRGSMWKY